MPCPGIAIMNRIQIIKSSLLDFESSISPDNTEADIIKHAQSLIKSDSFKCQGCGCTGSCRSSVRYLRYLITPENYQCHNHEFMRIIIDCFHCDTCKYTHANLFDSIIPYSSHSLRFIMHVLVDYASHTLATSSHARGDNLTIEMICRKWDISVSTLYRWKRRFVRHYQLWCAAILLKEKMKTQLEHVLSSQDIVRDFFDTTAFSFLQPNKKTHAHRIPGSSRSLPP